jgi:TolB-like protein/DNA-binding winged helix-turn-helix (wHTH) protein
MTDKIGWVATTHILGPFRLDGEAQLLLRGAEPVPLGKRAVAVLRALVEQPGIPVSKEALIEAAWAGLAVEENNLVVQIAALRRVFGEATGGEGWIETLPRRGYRFVGPVRIAEQSVANPRVEHQETVAGAPGASHLAMGDPTVLTLPAQPSIAVLPFQNMSGDPGQEYFADGVVEEIITALSRFRSLFVIARNSSFAYKGRFVDVKQVGRELGVRYVLEGSVRRSMNQVRVTAQLVDALSGAHLWADRFDDALEDIFDLQDRVAARVASEIEPRLAQVELERAKRKPTVNLGAYDYYVRALANCYPTTREQSEEVLRLAYKAIELDPGFASAYGIAAWFHSRRGQNQWTTDAMQERADALRLARRAAELGKEDAISLAFAGYTFAFAGREVENGAALADRAIELNPNLALAWGICAWVTLMLGQHDAAIDRAARAMRLSPLDPFMRGPQTTMAVAHLMAGRYAEAASWAAKALQPDPKFAPAWRIAAASHALAGHMEEAQAACARLRQLDPRLRVSNLGDVSAPYRPADLATFEAGLRKAGLPE